MGISKGEPPTKKRKRIGGIRQRIAAADAAEAERSSSSSRGQSTLAKFLVESWAKGELSPQKVQQIAELAMRDMSQVGNVQFKTLEKLAALGNHGATAQNCHKEIFWLWPSRIPSCLNRACIPFTSRKRQVCKAFSCHMRSLQAYFMIIKKLGRT